MQSIFKQTNPAEQRFFTAISQGNVVEMLKCLQQGVSITAKAPLGSKQALHFACQHNQAEMVNKLINLGAHVNAKTDRGFTPLHVAAQIGNKEIFLTLVRAGADVNSVTINGFGTTPLQEAAHHNQLVIVNILLSLGIDAHYKKKAFNKTAGDLAKLAGHNDMVIALSGYQAAFKKRSDIILKNWANIFASHTPPVEYYSQLREISLDMSADDYFKTLQVKLNQNYTAIKEEVAVLRSAIITVIKQYNVDKTLDKEVKQCIAKTEEAKHLQMTNTL